ncbi:MAG: transposase [Thermodesulfobacteriota bacterium]
MGGIRKRHSNAFKHKVAMAAIKGDKTTAELCQEFGVAASQISLWKQRLENSADQVFADKRKKDNKQPNVEKLYRIIGELTVERDFLSRVLDRSR